jgi:hypothetical protein
VAAQVRASVRLCWICGGQSGTGLGFLRVLRFPLPIFIPLVAPQSSKADTIGQLVAAVASGLSLTPVASLRGCEYACNLPVIVFSNKQLRNVKYTEKSLQIRLRVYKQLYRRSDRRVSAKLVPTFADRGVSRGQRNGSSRHYSRFSRPEPLLFLQVAPQLYSRG